MNYEQAKNACSQVRNVIGCIHPIIAPDETLSQDIPHPYEPIGILCKLKIGMQNPDENFCTAYDGSPCPLRFNEELLKEIGDRSTGR